MSKPARVRMQFDAEVARGTYNGIPYIPWHSSQTGKWMLPLDANDFKVGDQVRVTVERLPTPRPKGGRTR